MKRTFAAVIFLASLGVLIKLAARTSPEVPGNDAGAVAPAATPVGTTGPAAAPESNETGKAVLLARYRTASPRVREMVARLAERFGRNAEAIDRTDGERGLVLLDKLDMEALFLYEKYPVEFHRLREALGADAAADVLLHWREYFGLKRGRRDRSGDPDRRAGEPLTVAATGGVAVSVGTAADPGRASGRDRADRPPEGRPRGGGRRAGDPELHQPGPRGGRPSVRAADLRALRPDGHGGVPPPGARGLRPGEPVRPGARGAGRCDADGPGDDPDLGQRRIPRRAAPDASPRDGGRPSAARGGGRSGRGGRCEHPGAAAGRRAGRGGRAGAADGRTRRGRRGVRRLPRRHAPPPGDPGTRGARSDGAGDARQVRRGLRLPRGAAQARSGGDPADRAGRRRAADDRVAPVEVPPVVPRVAGPLGALALGRERPGDDPPDPPGRAGAGRRSSATARWRSTSSCRYTT